MSIPGSASPLFFQTAAGAAAAAGPIKSVRFNSADNASLSKTLSSDGNIKKWTWAGWVKRGKLSDNLEFFGINTGLSAQHLITLDGSDRIHFYRYANGYHFRRQTTQKFRDPSAWYHIVAVYDTDNATAADRAILYVNGSRITDFGNSTDPTLGETGYINDATYTQNIGSAGDNTREFDGYLADVYFIDGQALDPTSFGAFDDNGVWQAAAYSGSFGTNGFHLFDFANESGIGNDSSGNDNDFTTNNLTLNAVNYANAVATATNGEVPNGGTPYIVDVQPTNANLSYGSSPGIEEVFNGVYNSGYVYWVGTQYSSGNVTRARFDLRDFSSISTLRIYGGFSGYTAYNYQLLDSSKSAISGTSGSFGAIGWHSLTISGSPRYLEISCTSGSNRRLRLYAIEVNGTVLTSSDPSNIDVVRDVPTNGSADDDTGAGGEVSGNYATLNPLAATNTLSNGNLEATRSSDTQRAHSTIAVSSGKWYAECTTGQDSIAGISLASQAPSTYPGGDANSYGYQRGGNKYNNGSATSYGASFGTGDVIGVALDLDGGTLTFYKNGASQGTAYSGLSGTFVFAGRGGISSTLEKWNFGQRPFAYSAPSGFKALNTASLPTPTIADGSTAFDIATYTGNFTDDTAITGLNLSSAPDLVWIKARSQAYDHMMFDSVRGATKNLRPNKRDNEGTNANDLQSFDSNGFTVGYGGYVNGNNVTFVGWCWDGGTSTVSNTDGSITSSVRASQTNGFSIVKYEGTGANDSVGHGLSAAPDWIIFKDINRDNEPWLVYHSALGSSAYVFLNTTAAQTTGQSDFMNSTDPTSSVFSVGNAIGKQNRDGSNFLALCWTAVAGFSAFGSYEGNANNDGPFVYTGFRPAFVLTKWADGTDQWQIHDTSRSPENVASEILMPNTNSAEANYVYSEIDILSNGFKLRNSNQNINAASTYIYAAFSENAFSLNGGLAR